MYRLHGAIHAYGGTTVSARDTADSVITALTPAAWYRNATGVTSAGGFASQWDDYSGNTRHLVQATGTNQPAYSAGVFTFDGADNWMAASYTAAAPRTRYIVLNQVSWTANDYIIDGATPNTMVFLQTTAGASPQVRIQGSAGTSASSSSLVVGSFGIACCVFNGASSSLRINNDAAITASLTTPTSGGIIVGAVGTGVAVWSNIQVKEVIDFAATHSDAEQDSVITALNNALTVF